MSRRSHGVCLCHHHTTWSQRVSCRGLPHSPVATATSTPVLQSFTALTAGPGKGGSSRSILSDRVKLQLPVTCTYCNEPARHRQQTQLPLDLQAGPVGRQGHGTVPPPQDYCSRAHLGGLTLTDFAPIFCRGFTGFKIEEREHYI